MTSYWITSKYYRDLRLNFSIWFILFLFYFFKNIYTSNTKNVVVYYHCYNTPYSTTNHPRSLISLYKCHSGRVLHSALGKILISFLWKSFRHTYKYLTYIYWMASNNKKLQSVKNRFPENAYLMFTRRRRITIKCTYRMNALGNDFPWVIWRNFLYTYTHIHYYNKKGVIFWMNIYQHLY